MDDSSTDRRRNHDDHIGFRIDHDTHLRRGRPGDRAGLSGSTNTYAAELVRKGALFGSARRDGLDGCDGRDWTGREIVAICADEQTAGRGRLDHQWTSAVGESFIVSLVVSVPTAIVRDTSVNGWLQMIAGCEARNAIIAAIRDCGSPLGKDIVLKWPNDIFVDGKKLGGVLAEMVPLAATPIADGATGTTDVAAATERVGIVFGIGLNLTVPEDHLPTDKATSLQLVAHGLPDSMTLRDMIAAHLVDGLRSRLADFEADPQREATRAWRRCVRSAGRSASHARRISWTAPPCAAPRWNSTPTPPSPSETTTATCTPCAPPT